VRRAVLVADDGDAVFRQDMDAVADMLPERMLPTRMYEHDPSTSVRDEVSAGALLLAYSGHGTGSSKWGTWYDGHRIFDLTQMRNLGNGTRLPFMTAANCLNGWFNEYDRPHGMAEQFLLLNNKGGIASWAPASLGFPTPNSLILRELYQILLIDGDLALGSAATSARIQAHLQRPDLPLSLLEAFTYFGDPAVHWNMPAVLALDGEASPDPAVMGEAVTFILEHTVSDADQARGLTLVNTLPQEVVYQSASPPPSSIYARTLTWNLGDTPAGSYAIHVTCHVNTDLAHGQALRDEARLYDAAGSEQALQIETTVHDSPIAGLSAGNDGPTELGDVTALAAATMSGTNVVYTWDLGDGSPLQVGSSVQHTYPAVDTYVARVTATNGVSSRTESTTVTIVDVPPGASFISSSPDMIGQTTAFRSTSTGTNLTYEWDFGDGSPPVSTQESTVAHEYTGVGSFAVVLTVTNGAGTDVATGAVVMVDEVIAPVASFTSSSPDELGQATRFVNTSQDGGEEEGSVSYTWHFGDGSSSAAMHPSHTYHAAGIYPVSLNVTNSAGSDTFYGSVRVTDVPIDGLSMAHDGPTILGHATTLSASATAGTGISYLWSLGDGTRHSGQTVAHTYGTVGHYTVVLTATNTVNTLVATGTVQVFDEAIEGLTLSNSSPTYLGSATTFAASTTAGTSISYRWNLGDGTTSVLQNPVHTYGAAGDYTVILTATNSLGSLVKFDTVTVRDVPIGGLRIDHNSPTMLGSPTTLTASVTAGTNVVYNWDFGDGHAATGAHTAHTYATPGPHQVTVTASNGTNESDASTTIIVHDPDNTISLPLIRK
jgi:PKD repeat protein